jgi:hypothetical protein
MSLVLRFGSDACPKDAKAVWGARLIVKGNFVDFVHDRQDLKGLGDPIKDLLHALNVEGGLNYLKEMVGELLTTYFGDDLDPAMQHDTAEDFIIFYKNMVMHANTNGSYGYCYVSVWLDEPADEEPAGGTTTYVVEEDLAHGAFRDIRRREVSSPEELKKFIEDSRYKYEPDTDRVTRYWEDLGTKGKFGHGWSWFTVIEKKEG